MTRSELDCKFVAELKVEAKKAEYIHATSADCSDQPADIGFLIDESGSVHEANFLKNLNFVKQFVDLFEIGNSAVKISTFAFHTSIGNGFHFCCCKDKASIKSNIDNINYNGGGEDFEMALNFSRYTMFQSVNGARDFSLKILMFFTDSQSLIRDGGSILHELGIIVYAVDVLTNPYQRSPQPCQNQGTCISTGGSMYTCSCPEGFTSHNCQTVCQRSEEVDVFFAVDTSNGWQNFDLNTKVPTIMNKILPGLILGPMNTHIALLTYASSSNLRFDFNKYNDETKRQNLQRQLSSFGKTTDTNTNITALINSAHALLFEKNEITTEESKLIETFKEKVEIFAVGLDQSNEQFKVMLDIATTSFHIGDSLHHTIHSHIGNGVKFSTFDCDNDIHPNANCAQQFYGAWWYTDCHISNLYEKYLGGYFKSFADRIVWNT
ncbi:unnamed protein product [Mytilus coruscus]|uniref:Uncharacterized protein n=1 Tax=Mytilus coruscus TaxID=42192 RepID=A0A6J8D794_MYTCO|nr:unnamed protein product [Mytilus coruscus]